MTNNMSDYDLIMTNERNGYSIFNADYNPSPEAIAKVHETFDFIEANPNRWDQDTYGNDDSETNCFMGIVCRLNGAKPYISYWGEKREYMLHSAMDILEMSSLDHSDRADYIAMFIDGVLDAETNTYRPPTLDEMRERVSIAFGHDFRKRTIITRFLNDPTVDCCERDAADCDCPDKQV